MIGSGGGGFVIDTTTLFLVMLGLAALGGPGFGSCHGGDGDPHRKPRGGIAERILSVKCQRVPIQRRPVNAWPPSSASGMNSKLCVTTPRNTMPSSNASAEKPMPFVRCSTPTIPRPSPSSVSAFVSMPPATSDSPSRVPSSAA